MAPEDKSTKPKLVIHDVKHYRQRYNWDCGVTCVLMVLPEHQRKELIENFNSICEEEGFNQSTWTIDLCYLLKRFNVTHHMYTTMLGVNEDYRIHGYYKKIIDLDRERVERRFSLARSAGVVVTGRALSLAQLARHVAATGPAIALVDAARLACHLCKHNKLRAELRRWLGGGYRGHYVVVCGLRGSHALYADPAARAPLCAAPLPRLWAAAAAPGTDADLVLLATTGEHLPARTPTTEAATVSKDAAAHPPASVVANGAALSTDAGRASSTRHRAPVRTSQTSPSRSRRAASLAAPRSGGSAPLSSVRSSSCHRAPQGTNTPSPKRSPPPKLLHETRPLAEKEQREKPRKSAHTLHVSCQTIPKKLIQTSL